MIVSSRNCHLIATALWGVGGGGVNGWTVLQLFAVFYSPHRLQSGRGGELHLTMTNFSMICTPPNIRRNFFNFVFCLVLGVQLSLVQAFKWTGECFFIFKAIILHTRPVFIVFIQCARISGNSHHCLLFCRSVHMVTHKIRSWSGNTHH